MTNRPIYSYRLSIIHFWSLVFIYIWAGPHHLLYTSVPDWAQTLGMIFSIMLLAPSWGGAINGLLTLRGAWHLLRTDPIIKFMVAAITFYGMATFEGPLLSIKTINAFGHYTDWIIAHVHGGTLGWNGFLTFAMVYYLVPKLWNTKLYSLKLANIHFWIGLAAVLLYYISMLVAGLTQGLMWLAVDDAGRLVYPDFMESVIRVLPLYWVRAFAGVLYIAGFIIMVYNLYKTLKSAPQSSAKPTYAAKKANFSNENVSGHKKLEGMGLTFSVLTFICIAVGSIISIAPVLSLHKYVKPENIIDPYSPLELAGRDIYVKEGCYTCHSQMIRKLPAEVLRYGDPSTIEESMWDRPFQWGSKRTGPDLARVGGKYPDLWHYMHMIDPRSTTPNSTMPNYPWLAQKKTDFSTLRRKLSVMKRLGVPYSDEEVANADILAKKQAIEIANGLRESGVQDEQLELRQIVALIAYLQVLGQMSPQPESETNP